jgi:glycosyltransferase involved in cell wall biosynthesis
VTDRVLLITKTDFSVPRDGGTMRVSAIVDALCDAGFVVDSIAVRSAEGKLQPSTLRTRPSCLVAPIWWSAVGRAGTSTMRTASLSVARWFSTAVADQISRLIREQAYAAVVIEFSQLLIYRGLFDGIPVILDMHNIEHEILQNYADSANSKRAKMLAAYEAIRVRKLERRALDMVDAVVAVSDRDAELIKTIAKRRGDAIVLTAPNGVADDAFDVVSVLTELPTIVFIANLGWRPNIDAVHWLVQHVWPLVRQKCPSAVLQLVGRQPAKEILEYGRVDGVSVHPDVPSTFPYLARAAVATAPLQAAGGTRLKIIEAMATGTSVVATSLGAMGLDSLVECGSMVIADNPDEFAAALVGYIETPRDAERARSGVEPYRWRNALQPLVELVDDARLGKGFSVDRSAATGRSDLNSPSSE